MIGSALKKLASQNGMAIDGGVAYGALKGCFVSLSEGAGYKRICIYVGPYQRPEIEAPTKEDEVPAHLEVANAVADLIIEQASDFKTYRIMNSQHKLPGVALAQGGSIVQVNFFDNPGTMKCVQAFIDNILPQVAPYTEPQRCRKCGLDNDGSTKPVLLHGEAVVPMHAACAEEAVAAAAKRKKKNKAKPGGTILGIIGALVGALIGAVLWALLGIAGYIASIVGFAIAFLAGKGYDLLGGKPGAIKLITLIVCVILAVVAGNLGSEIYWLHDLYQEEVANLSAGEIAVPESEFLQLTIPMLWTEPDIRSTIAGNVAMGLVFAALGCWTELRKSTGSGENNVRVLKG